jgi:hypothetical protein
LSKPTSVYKDWRGVEIQVGDLAIYHGPTSGNLVGEVDSFTNSGQVRLKVIHAASRGGQLKKSVPPNRCTIVLGLPNTELETVESINAKAKAWQELRLERERSHTVRSVPVAPNRADFPLKPGQQGAPIRLSNNGFSWGTRHYDDAAYDAAYRIYRDAYQHYREHACSVCELPSLELAEKFCYEALAERRI